MHSAATHCNTLQHNATSYVRTQHVARLNARYVAVCCGALCCVAVRCSVLQHDTRMRHMTY